MLSIGARLLADGGFRGLATWLRTPVTRPANGQLTAAELRLNQRIARTRYVVENTHRELKSRFRFIGGYVRIGDPAYVCRIVKACAALYNFALEMEAEELF